MLSKRLFQQARVGNLRNGCNFIPIVQNFMPIVQNELRSQCQRRGLIGGNETAVRGSDDAGGDGDCIDDDDGDGDGDGDI